MRGREQFEKEVREWENKRGTQVGLSLIFEPEGPKWKQRAPDTRLFNENSLPFYIIIIMFIIFENAGAWV